MPPSDEYASELTADFSEVLEATESIRVKRRRKTEPRVRKEWLELA